MVEWRRFPDAVSKFHFSQVHETCWVNGDMKYSKIVLDVSSFDVTY